MTSFKVALIVGSLRKESFNRKIAHAITKLEIKNISFGLLNIGNLPLYNEDLEKDVPIEWKNFREELQSFDAVLFVTPEYNRSVPGVLKNALDVASRPYGKNIWDAKPAAIISSTIGGLGAFGANHHLRQSLVFLNMPVLQQPEAYISNAASLFDETGELINKSTQDFLKTFLEKFEAWVERNI
ncbi:NAD(P)H-dependent oxidoreductase [Sphingobacterium sp. SRCM116780]|uniref:NADPH-dependent FMN reductase n=1 Tax=Sphingobacterium sp. SRCM116780 TaxID=2907623 RepID=UPI001F2E3D5E|nr:NAD(P)H-dependent oxidoreductase [Sphingobacterium sp. SRCM116780]UIR57790.1 NAD(P)H-dependent oxidoreductase [Sphingobacterium sp. SRCM116780]